MSYKTVLLSVLLSVSYQNFSQTACSTYLGSRQKIFNALVQKAKAAGAYKPDISPNPNDDSQTNYLKHEKAWDDVSLGEIADKWVAICRCNQGVTQEEYENEIYGKKDGGLLINGGISWDTYDYKGQIYTKDYSIFGDLNPPSKIYTSADCVHGANTNAGQPNYSDCANVQIDKADDPQQFGNAFLFAHCACEKGVPNEQKAKELEASMKINYDNCKTYYGSDLGLPAPLSWKDCPILSGSGDVGNGSKSNDKFSVYEDKILSEKATNFIQELAANSKDPDLKQFAADLNTIDETNQQVARYNEFFHLTPSQSDVEFNNLMNNAMQGIAIAKFVINSFKEDVVELTPSQEQARAAAIKIWNNIQMIYNETKVIPYFFQYNGVDLERINELEESYLVYDLTTAKERYLLIRYWWSGRRLEITELEQIYAEINAMDPVDVLRKIDAWQSTANLDLDGVIPLANSDKSFSLNKNILTLKKARCYRSMGETELADKLLEQTDFNVSTFEAIKLMREAFNATDYETVMNFYPIVKTYFENEEKPKGFYFFDIDKSNNTKSNSKVGNDFSLSRVELIKLLSTGVYVHIMMGNHTQAEHELKFLEEYINCKPNTNYNTIAPFEEEVILLSMQAANYILKGDIESAEIAIDKAIELEKTLPLGTYKPWVQFIKYKQLGAANRFDEAHALYREISKNPLLSNNTYSAYIDVEELKYQKCELLFKQGEYDRVLRGLEMLEIVNPKPKYKLLRAKVYSAQGNETEAIKALQN